MVFEEQALELGLIANTSFGIGIVIVPICLFLFAIFGLYWHINRKKQRNTN